MKRLIFCAMVACGVGLLARDMEIVPLAPEETKALVAAAKDATDKRAAADNAEKWLESEKQRVKMAHKALEDTTRKCLPGAWNYISDSTASTWTTGPHIPCWTWDFDKAMKYLVKQ